MINQIVRAEQYLTALKEKKAYRVFVGFDGYVDAIVRPVCGRKKDGRCEYFSTIEEFGKYIQGKTKRGCSIELKKELEKSGGNAFLFADTLAGLQIDTCCVGTFGYPEIHEVFQTKNEDLKLISISDPGKCSALEFMDGKVMLADNSGIEGMDYQLLKQRVGEQQLLAMVENSDVVAFMNWSEVRGSNEIWKGFLCNILPKIESSQKKQLFLDISDCSGREKTDILNMLIMIREFSQYFEVILSLNFNEFQATSSLLEELDDRKKIVYGRKEKARKIYEFCELKYLFIHLQDRAYGLNEKDEFCVKTRFVKKPKISTGGGDNFNAGLLYGLLHHLDIEAAMTVGNAASGYYITRGHSASQRELLQYLEEWKQEIIGGK